MSHPSPRAIQVLLLLSTLFISASLSRPAQVEAQSVIRLTSYTGEDFGPAWDPRGGTIAYARNKAVGSGIYDAYRVLSSGQGGEQPLMTGIAADFGVAVGLSWIGSTGLLAVEEAISGFEILKFDTSLAPFDRTSANGADGANSVLLSVDGGGGASLTKISRDGLVGLIRFSSFGSVGAQSVRVGAVASMVGQTSSRFGTAIFSSGSTVNAAFMRGGAISPDGSFIVVPISQTGATAPHDLFYQSLSDLNTTLNLTNSRTLSVSNVNPDISPDGKTIAFARSTNGDSGPYDLYTIGIDGSALTQITNTPNFSETYPSWAPDGSALAFMGKHSVGHESEAPALAAGEVANTNIYLLTLAPALTVTPGTILMEPPVVEIANRRVKFTLTPFKDAARTQAQARIIKSAFQSLGSQSTSRASSKVTFRYELRVRSSSLAKAESRRKFSNRNVVSFRSLPPASYTAKFRVQILQKKGRTIKVIGKTKFSPSATFTVN